MVRPMMLLQRNGLIKGKRGARQVKRFLVQRMKDNEMWCSLMSDYELIDYINFSDCHDEYYRIFEVSEFGKAKPCHYKGWQPMCLIEVVDEDGNVVLSGYGEDH